jgi:hypothetical protein
VVVVVEQKQMLAVQVEQVVAEQVLHQQLELQELQTQAAAVVVVIQIIQMAALAVQELLFLNIPMNTQQNLVQVLYSQQIVHQLQDIKFQQLQQQLLEQ